MTIETFTALSLLSKAQKYLRPLGPFEELLWQMDKRSPLHASLVAHVNGFTTIDDWTGALERTRRRHPLWSAVISQREAGRPEFVEMHNPTIPMKVVQGDFTQLWEGELGRECSLPFDTERGPLVRAVLMHTKSSSMLILSAHHSICDGMSLAFAMRDVLQALSGVELSDLNLHLSQEDTLGMRLQPRAHEVEVSARSEPPSSDSVYRSKSSIVPDVRSLQFSAALTDALRVRARREKTTVHAALVAASGIAARRTPGYAAGRDLHLCSTISNRKLLGAPEDCGVFFTASDFVLAETPSEDLWNLARRSKSMLRAGQTAEGVEGVLGAVSGIVRSGLDAYSAGEQGGKLFLFDIHLSNLGAVSIPTSYGSLSLQALWGPAVLLGFEGEQTLGVSTVGGHLCLLHTSYTALSNFLEQISTILSLACFS